MDPFGGEDPFADAAAASAADAPEAPVFGGEDAALAFEDPLPAAVQLGDPTAVAAPPPGQELDMSEFQESVADALDPTPAPAPVPGHPPALITHASQDVVQLSSEDTQAAFIGGFTPHPVEVVPASPGPVINDPRVAWHKKNQAALALKDKEEVEAKKAAAAKAKAFVSKFSEDRGKQLDSKKKSNRQAEKASPESGVPKGATWEKVDLLINFKREDKAHVKDMSRFKAVLQTCKALDVPVAIRAK